MRVFQDITVIELIEKAPLVGGIIVLVGGIIMIAIFVMIVCGVEVKATPFVIAVGIVMIGTFGMIIGAVGWVWKMFQ